MNFGNAVEWERVKTYILEASVELGVNGRTYSSYFLVVASVDRVLCGEVRTNSSAPRHEWSTVTCNTHYITMTSFRNEYIT